MLAKSRAKTPANYLSNWVKVYVTLKSVTNVAVDKVTVASRQE